MKLLYVLIIAESLSEAKTFGNLLDKVEISCDNKFNSGAVVFKFDLSV